MAGFFTWIWDKICELWNKSADAVWACCVYCFNALCAIGNWFWDLLLASGDIIYYELLWVLDRALIMGVGVVFWLFDLLPGLPLGGFQSVADTVVPVVSFSNDILPVAELFVCISVYLQVLCLWVVYKFVKSWFPTVSGS